MAWWQLTLSALVAWTLLGMALDLLAHHCSVWVRDQAGNRTRRQWGYRLLVFAAGPVSWLLRAGIYMVFR